MRALSNGWSVERELAASTVEQVHDLKRVLVMVNSAKGTSAPDPLHIPRPDPTPDHQPTQPKPMSTPTDLATFFGSTP